MLPDLARKMLKYFSLSSLPLVSKGKAKGRHKHHKHSGATAKVHHWGNEDVLPGIKINTDAMARMTQLVQEGFVKISE